MTGFVCESFKINLEFSFSTKFRGHFTQNFFFKANSNRFPSTRIEGNREKSFYRVSKRFTATCVFIAIWNAMTQKPPLWRLIFHVLLIFKNSKLLDPYSTNGYIWGSNKFECINQHQHGKLIVEKLFFLISFKKLVF